MLVRNGSRVFVRKEKKWKFRSFDCLLWVLNFQITWKLYIFSYRSVTKEVYILKSCMKSLIFWKLKIKWIRYFWKGNIYDSKIKEI